MSKKIFDKAVKHFETLDEKAAPLGAPLPFDEMLKASCLMYEVAKLKPTKTFKKTPEEMVNELWKLARKNDRVEYAMKPFIRPLLSHVSTGKPAFDKLPTEKKLRNKHKERYRLQYRKAVKCYIDKKNVIIVELEP